MKESLNGIISTKETMPNYLKTLGFGDLVEFSDRVKHELEMTPNNNGTNNKEIAIEEVCKKILKNESFSPDEYNVLEHQVKKVIDKKTNQRKQDEKVRAEEAERAGYLGETDRDREGKIKPTGDADAHEKFLQDN